MTAFATLVNAGFPPRPVLDALKEGGRIGPDEDLDALEMEWLAGTAAKEAQRQMEAVVNDENDNNVAIPTRGDGVVCAYGQEGQDRGSNRPSGCGGVVLPPADRRGCADPSGYPDGSEIRRSSGHIRHARRGTDTTVGGTPEVSFP